MYVRGGGRVRGGRAPPRAASQHARTQTNTQKKQNKVALSSTLPPHPHIVRLLDDLAEGRAQLVIVWELVRGPDLLDLLNDAGRLPEPAAAFYAAQLLSALLFMHAAGFCHR